MTTPPSKWPLEFKDSKLSGLYVRELYWLAHQIKTKAKEVFDKYPVRPDQTFVSADISGLEIVYSMLSAAAKVNELLFPQRPKQEYKERAKYLQVLVADLQLKELLDKKVRNTVEHFGEYLDDFNLEHSKFASPTRYLVAFNLILSHMQPIHEPTVPFPLYATPMGPVPVCPVRVYVASTRIFHNFSWSIDLAALEREAQRLAEKLALQFAEERPEDWVSGAICL